MEATSSTEGLEKQTAEATARSSSPSAEPALEKPATPPAGEKKKKKKKKKSNGCGVDGCDGRVVLLVGDCKWCMKSFCQAHRLPEAHICPNIKDCKQQSFDNNAAKVGLGKCNAPKLVSAF